MLMLNSKKSLWHSTSKQMKVNILGIYNCPVVRWMSVIGYFTITNDKIWAFKLTFYIEIVFCRKIIRTLWIGRKWAHKQYHISDTGVFWPCYTSQWLGKNSDRRHGYRKKGQQVWRWAWDINDTLNMNEWSRGADKK